MPRSSPLDGFSLAYDRTGAGPPVMLLHGSQPNVLWPTHDPLFPLPGAIGSTRT